MHPRTLPALFLSCLLAACTTSPQSGKVDSKSFQSSTRFEHRTQTRPDGKTLLIVAPASSIVQDQTIMERESRTYAEAQANHACPKGYDFYAEGALMSRRTERSYIFKCKE
jgi:hypothetical protein